MVNRLIAFGVGSKVHGLLHILICGLKGCSLYGIRVMYFLCFDMVLQKRKGIKGDIRVAKPFEQS